MDKEWLLSRILIAPTGCWEWKYARDPRGYGRTDVNIYGRREQMAHRVSFSLYKGEIGIGLTIDHLCKNTCCCNPDHLEMVTLKENILRGDGGAGTNARKTHCIKGHAFDEENTMWRKDGGRYCRACGRERNKRCRDNDFYRLKTRDLARWKRSLLPKKLKINHCKSGHEFTKENTYIYKGFRQCRQCINARSRKYKKKLRD